MRIMLLHVPEYNEFLFNLKGQTLQAQYEDSYFIDALRQPYSPNN